MVVVVVFSDDLRLIIKTKEEKNVLLEDEVEELGNYVKKVQDDSRRREMELLSEMDLIHGKNEVSYISCAILCYKSTH